MVRSFAIATALVGVLFAGPAFAASCPKHMGEIDAALSKASLSPAQMNEVKQLRSQGEAHHKAGRHAESVATLTKAKGMLNIK